MKLYPSTTAMAGLIVVLSLASCSSPDSQETQGTPEFEIVEATIEDIQKRNNDETDYCYRNRSHVP